MRNRNVNSFNLSKNIPKNLLLIIYKKKRGKVNIKEMSKSFIIELFIKQNRN